jgi:hypothetical protein
MSRNRQKRQVIVPSKAPSNIGWSEETKRKVGIIGLTFIFIFVAGPIIWSVLFPTS